MCELKGDGRSERTRWDNAAVAEAAGTINQRDRQVFGDRRVLQTVIHDNDGILWRLTGDEFGAEPPVARNDGWRPCGQQQRLVANFSGGMAREVDAFLPVEPATVSARQKPGCAAVFFDQVGDE